MKLPFTKSYMTCSSVVKHIRELNWSWLLFCCSPALIFLVVFFFLDMNPFRWVPLRNDEVGWYMDIHSVIEHGVPPGFTGYNETHAAIGRFGPWGSFLVCVMALFGKVFGWRWYSPLFMNVFYMTLANFVFLLFTRPSRQVALKLAALNAVLFASIYYMFTGMSECTRFSMSIVLAGLFFFLLKDENREKRSYVIVLSVIAPILLFLFINSYVLFAFLLPVYGYIWYRYLNVGRFRSLSFIFLCVILPAFFALACLFLQVKTSAPYPTNTLLSYLKQGNVVSFFTILTRTIAWNYKNANLSFLFKSSSLWPGFVSSYLFFYYLLLVIILIRLLASLKRNRKINVLELLIFYALSVFVIAFLAFYSTRHPWTYIRGLNVAFVFGLYLVCMLDWPKLQPILFALVFMQFFPFVAALKDEMAMRYAPNRFGGGYELFEKYTQVFSSKLVPAESKDPWDNTIAFYGWTYNFNCAIPAGLSWNYILDNHQVRKPRYIITDRRREWAFPGYTKTYSDNLVNIFEKTKKRKRGKDRAI